MPMRKRKAGPRRVFLHFAIAGFLLASAATIVIGREYWPLSPYPMFSDIEEPADLTRYRAIGITTDGQAIELGRPGHLAPFHHVRLNSALSKMARRDDGDRRLAVAAGELLDRYERRRAAGAHRGPRLVAMRIVRFHWPIEPDASNVAAPVSVEVLVEVRDNRDEAGLPEDRP